MRTLLYLALRRRHRLLQAYRDQLRTDLRLRAQRDQLELAVEALEQDLQELAAENAALLDRLHEAQRDAGTSRAAIDVLAGLVEHCSTGAGHGTDLGVVKHLLLHTGRP